MTAGTVAAMKAAERPELVEAFERWRELWERWLKYTALSEPVDGDTPVIGDILELQRKVQAIEPNTLWGHGAHFAASRALKEFTSAVDWGVNEDNDADVVLPLGVIREAHAFMMAALVGLQLN